MKETNYIKDFYSPALTFNNLMRLVEEQYTNGDFSILTEGSIEDDTLTVAMIPEIPITEIGWALLKTDKGGEVNQTQRTQLNNFLKNIKGRDLKERLDSINEFYNLGEEGATILLGNSSASTISRSLAYLTFFKTLTTIITNFNASSAGFTFESFLGVLLGGTQIPTNQNTIADLETENGVPISLKLYNEASVAVDGSYADLVNDLVRGDYMQYVVVMKRLEMTREDDPLSTEGSLDFYRFNFTVDNVVNILSKTKAETVVQLPVAFLKDREYDFNTLTPGAKTVTTEELEQMFVDRVTNEFPTIATDLVDNINWAKNTILFTGSPPKPGEGTFRKTGLNRGEMPPIYQVLQPLLYDEVDNPGGVIRDNEHLKDIVSRLHVYNNEIIAYRSKLNPARDAAKKELKWASVEDSVVFYNGLLDADAKRRALTNTRGAIYDDQFHLNKTQVKSIENLAAPTVEGLFPPGQSNGAYIGSIEVGVSAVLKALNNVKDLINESVFDIFKNLKQLTTNIQAYFAQGLKHDEQAQNAVTAAGNIEGKTEEIRKENK